MKPAQPQAEEEAQPIVQAIRAFNRLYMSSMNLLGSHYLGSEYSIAEARVFFEVRENDGCTATHIANVMNLDKSYLSRIIKSHEKKGYLCRTASPSDGRSYCLHLTEKGRQRTADFIAKSNREIGAIIAPLSAAEQEELYTLLARASELLQRTQRVQPKPADKDVPSQKEEAK